MKSSPGRTSPGCTVCGNGSERPSLSTAGTIAADQINLGADDVEDALVIFNRIRGFAGDFVALGAASPMRHGVDNGVACNRLDVYDASLALANDAAGLPPPLHSVDDLRQFIAVRSLFGNSGSSYAYLRPRPERGVSVELRCVDKQPTLARVLGLAALAKAIMFSGIDPREIPRLSVNPLPRARREGIADPNATRALLAQMANFLPADERKYLSSLPPDSRSVWPTTGGSLAVKEAHRQLALAWLEGNRSHQSGVL